MEPAGAVGVDVGFSMCGFPVVVERAGVVETVNVARTVLGVGEDITVSMPGVALGGEVEAGRRNGTEPRLAVDVVDTADANVLGCVGFVAVAVAVVSGSVGGIGGCVGFAVVIGAGSVVGIMDGVGVVSGSVGSIGGDVGDIDVVGGCVGFAVVIGAGSIVGIMDGVSVGNIIANVDVSGIRVSVNDIVCNVVSIGLNDVSGPDD